MGVETTGASRAFLWGILGILLLGCHGALLGLSPGFDYTLTNAEKPIRALVLLETLAGCLYLIGAALIRRSSSHQRLLIWVIFVGLVSRAMMFASVPMLEDDYYRYLWDGGVLAHGFNPYRYAPADVVAASPSVPAPLRQLAVDSGEVVLRVNHPTLRTIYPPVAQACFALAHGIRPWSLNAWRGVLLLSDLVALVLLLLLLRSNRRSLLWIALYWWNPLIIKETYNSGHMDVLLVPLLIGWLLLISRRQWVGGSLLLALAIGVKVWPLLLVPLVFRHAVRAGWRGGSGLALLVLIAGLLAVPIGLAGWDPTSGFHAYGERWEMNDALFMLLLWGVQAVLPWLRLGLEDPQQITRLLVAGMLFGGSLALSRRPLGQAADVGRRVAMITAALFLLSPTQFPWYAIWFIPWLVVWPRWSLLSLTLTLPLYYLRFYLASRNRVAWFDYGIVWIEYAPAWALLTLEAVQAWRKRRRV